MATLSDHLRRDAEDAARSYIRIQLNRFRRRMEESAKADIQQAIEAAEAGEAIDGLALGQEVGERAFSNFLTGEPQPAIESTPPESPEVKALENLGFRSGESATIVSR